MAEQQPPPSPNITIDLEIPRVHGPITEEDISNAVLYTDRIKGLHRDYPDLVPADAIAKAALHQHKVTK